MPTAQQYSACDPRATKLEIFNHQLHVNGRPVPIRAPDNPQPRMLHKGFYYETEDELVIARLLSKQNIHVFHHARFSLTMRDGTQSVWSPDFMFPRANFLDVGNPNRQLLIHGLEVKPSKATPGIIERQTLLVDQHNVHIHIIYPADVRQYVEAGSMPLHFFRM